jgi:hypothetical protein
MAIRNLALAHKYNAAYYPVACQFILQRYFEMHYLMSITDAVETQVWQKLSKKQ